jgi:hypothetical protein
MRRRLHALTWVGLLSGVFFASCLARRSETFVRQTDDDAGPPDATSLDMPDAGDAAPDALDIAPHAVLGIDPPHGPFKGGTHVTIRGNGFASDTRVWFGDVEVPQSSLTPLDPQRLELDTPAGSSGSVDVRVQNGDAESTGASLSGGFTYDAFYAEPADGPTSGGTIITLKGDDTEWDESTSVEIDRHPCTDVKLVSPSELSCTTPPGDAGAKVLSVINGDDVEDVLDGFSYGNTDNGFRGGLSGDSLSSELTVLAFDNIEGKALPGVAVLLGDSVDSGQVKYTDRNGVVTFTGELGEKQSVTLALKCFQPITFYDVPVDHLTAYLDPVLSPACADLGELPPAGGTPGVSASVSGEVVWPLDKELKRRGFSNVPQPASDSESQVAYVFRLWDSPDAAFSLPTSGAVTRDSIGEIGYRFSDVYWPACIGFRNGQCVRQTAADPGNFTLYTLAGIQNSATTPPKFTAYAMGLVRGVAVKPHQSLSDVYIQVDVPLDHALGFTLDPPTPGPRGPDRIRASVAVKVEDGGYALLPAGSISHPLPGASEFSFVGIPPLIGTLSGAEYLLSARAVTGAQEDEPLSVIGAFSTTNSGLRPDLGGFVPVPFLTTPAKDENWDFRAISLAPDPTKRPVDLTVVRIQAGAGLYEWTLVAPGRRDELVLPDLGQLAPAAALPGGSISIVPTLARIRTGFKYGTLRYRELAARGWSAYASDTFYTQH